MRVAGLLIVLVLLPGQEPQGWSRLTRGEETIDVYRDRWGVPHIFAPSVEAAFWAEGYCEAQDRFQQMDKFRRSAKGELAEVVGEKALKNDLDRRRRGYTTDELRAMVSKIGDRARAGMSAYADGVNAWIREEGMKARSWDDTDTLAIGIMMARQFGEAGDLELKIKQGFALIAETVGKDRAMAVLNDLYRLRDPTAPTTLHDHLRAAPRDDRGSYHRAPTAADPEWYASYHRELAEIFLSREACGLPTYFGSNAWVVMPKKSVTGNAMLYGGPMMGFGAPSICNEVHLNAPGLQVAGMSFPGAPGVLIGFNDRVAWTTTSGWGDVVDVYELELNPENPDEYRYKGEWRPFEKFESEIRVKDRDPERITVYRSVYGPIFGERDLKNHRAYTAAMSFWKKENETFEGALELQFARSVADCARAAAKIPTSHNYLAADVEGHIGFWYCGKFPKRKPGHDPRLPQPGDGSMDWEGFIPFEELPQGIDPSHGFFANWNNKPARDWEPTLYGKVFWGKKIIDDLEREEKLSFEKMWSLSRETAEHAFLADYFIPHLLPMIEDGELKAGLTAWDRMKREGEVWPDFLMEVLRKVAKKVFVKGLGLLAAEKLMEPVLMNLLLYLYEGPECAVTVEFPWVSPEKLKEITREAIKDVWAGDREKLRFHPSQVNFGEGIGKVPSPRERGTYQMAVELTKEGPRALTLCAPGQNESSESPHFNDQIRLFRDWKGKAFVFKKEEM